MLPLLPLLRCQLPAALHARCLRARCPARVPSQLEGTPNPSEVAKNYRAGYYTCTRYDIDDDGKGAYIVSKENIETKQKDETVTFSTKDDAAEFLENTGDPKDKFYGQLLRRTQL